MAKMGGCSGQDVVSILFTYVSLRITPGKDLLAKIESHAVERMPSYGPKEASKLLSALSRLGMTPGPEFISRFEATCRSSIAEFDSISLTTVKDPNPWISQAPWFVCFLNNKARTNIESMDHVMSAELLAADHTLDRWSHAGSFGLRESWHCAAERTAYGDRGSLCRLHAQLHGS